MKDPKEMSIYDIAREILQKTNDGNDLAPEHLKLVEYGVNHNLNEKGEVALYELLENVRNGYKKPWYHGIENMTKDHEGFIYWKGIRVEHYSFDDYDKADKAAKELAERCRTLEANGIPVSCTNAIWMWNDDNEKCSSCGKTMIVFGDLAKKLCIQCSEKSS